MGLTAKQQRFCEEYVIDCNATQAAIRAGYSAKTAYSIGDENLKKPEIQECLQTLQGAAQERNKLDFDYIINGFRKIAETAEKESDRNTALSNLAKHLGFYEAHQNQKKPDKSAIEKYIETLDSDRLDDLIFNK